MSLQIITSQVTKSSNNHYSPLEELIKSRDKVVSWKIAIKSKQDQNKDLDVQVSDITQRVELYKKHPIWERTKFALLGVASLVSGVAVFVFGMIKLCAINFNIYDPRLSLAIVSLAVVTTAFMGVAAGSLGTAFTSFKSIKSLEKESASLQKSINKNSEEIENAQNAILKENDKIKKLKQELEIQLEETYVKIDNLQKENAHPDFVRLYTVMSDKIAQLLNADKTLGDFRGMNDKQWELIAAQVSNLPNIPNVAPDKRKLINTIIYIWSSNGLEVPVGRNWEKANVANQYLKIWSQDGTQEILKKILRNDLLGLSTMSSNESLSAETARLL